MITFLKKNLFLARSLFVMLLLIVSSTIPHVAFAQVGNLGNIGGTVAAIGGGAIDNLLQSVSYFIFSFSAAFLGLVGLLFNWVVTVTVFQFAVFFANTPGFLLAWGILRDVGNIMLLFGFIFMGISTILDIQTFSAKKTLPGLIIFAVLLNFSLFASEAVVDIANALSSSFYTQAGASYFTSQEGGQNTTSGSCNISVSSGGSLTSAGNCSANGISGNIITASGLASVWSDGSNLTPTTGPLILFLLSIFMIIAAVVLASGLIMLVVRAIMLVFLLIVSPLGFAAMALPPLHSLAQTWWKKLISEAFFAPVFLLLIFVSLKIMSAITAGSGGGTGAPNFAQAITSPGSSNVGVFFIFVLVAGFMIMSLVAAKKMGAIGSSFATKTAGAATLGTFGFVGRRTVGRGMNRLAANVRKSDFGRTNFGRFVAGGFDKVANSSMDLRASKMFGNIPGTKTLGNASGKGGYTGIVHKAEEERTKYAKSLKNSDVEVASLARIDEDVKTQTREFKRQIAATDTEKTRLQNEDRELLRRITATEAEKVRLDNERTALSTRIARTSDSAERERLENERTALSTRITAADTEKTRLENERTALSTRITAVDAQKIQLETDRDDVLEALKKEKRDLNPQQQYANNLEKPMPKYLTPFYMFTVENEANHHAADTLKKEVKKDDIQKLTDALGRASTGGGGGGHAPAPAAHAPAPAAHGPAAHGPAPAAGPH